MEKYFTSAEHPGLGLISLVVDEGEHFVAIVNGDPEDVLAERAEEIDLDDFHRMCDMVASGQIRLITGD